MFTLPLVAQQVVVILVVIVLVIFLLLDKLRPAALFFAAVLLFLLLNIIQIEDFLDALANKSILSIFLLIFITAGIKEHFNLIAWMDKLFASAQTGKSFMLRMTLGVSGLSSFLNNTPIVALFLPYVYQWSKRHNISPSKLLIPLSFAAIVGGMMTVIGTSTNLVLNGLIVSKNMPTPGFIDYLLPGLLVTIGGIVFLYFWGYKLLPNNVELLNTVKSAPREYLIELKVVQNASIIGQTVQDANLRNLNEVYLFEIIRHKQSISPVKPTDEICAGDILVFAGETQNVIELLDRHKDFTLPIKNDGSDELHRLNLQEAVIPYNSELIGQTLKKIQFRERYDAAVVAVHRNGEKLRGKIGEVILEAGDLLLINPGEQFVKRNRACNAIYLISTIRKTKQANKLGKKGFVLVLLALVLAMGLGAIDLFFALILLTTYMVATKLLSVQEMKNQLDISLLVVLVSSLAFSTALIESGTAKVLAEGFMEFFKPLGNIGLVVGVYLITLILTSFVTHVAAVSIVFPIGYAIGMQTPELNMTALFIAIAFAASASFHSPFSYQTNLMVYGPGGYKFKDYLKIGTPFTVIYSILTLGFILFYYQL